MSRDTRINRLLQWNAGERPGPWSVTIFPTNKCNLPCEHCWLRWGTYDRTYKSEMEDARLLELVDEAAALGVRDWTIVGGGDPMVRGKVVMQMCTSIRAHAMDGTLHTNGTLFKPSQLDELIDMRWGRVTMSLDGPTAETNNAIRGAGFDKAVGNMRRLTERKRERAAVLPAMSINSVITNLNYDKIDELLRLAGDTGCDTVNLTLLLVESERAEPFALTDAQKVELQRHVQHAIPLARELGIAHNFEFFLRDEVIADSTHMPHGQSPRAESGIARSMCFEPFSALTIHPNGLTGPCCVFWDEEANSVYERSLGDVWYGDYFELLRQDFLANKARKYCALCPSSLYARIQDTRATLVNESQPVGRRAARLVAKAARSLQADGLATTLRKAGGWTKRQLGQN
jgi:MoaA/NifB/PqqE/SkfB family radical SAM enzyme